MRVRFLRDYRGPYTFEAWHAAGEVVELPEGEALALLGAGVAEPADTVQEARPRTPKRTGAKGRGRK